MTLNPLFEFLMNDQDIEMFMQAFDDFMENATIEEKNYVRREAAREYTKSFFEKKASELEVTVDYYMQEFM